MGLMNDIPAEFAANLLEGHTLRVMLNEHADLEITLDDVVLSVNGALDSLDPDSVRVLLYALVTRDLIKRNQAKEAAEAAKDPKELVNALVTAYDSYNVSLLLEVWEKLVKNAGRAGAESMVNKKLGKEQARDLFRVINGEG